MNDADKMMRFKDECLDITKPQYDDYYKFVNDQEYVRQLLREISPEFDPDGPVLDQIKCGIASLLTDKTGSP